MTKTSNQLLREFLTHIFEFGIKCQKSLSTQFDAVFRQGQSDRRLHLFPCSRQIIKRTLESCIFRFINDCVYLLQTRGGIAYGQI